MRSKKIELITSVVRGVYDLQMLRMQMGARLAANFGAKLKEHGLIKDDTDLEEEQEKILDRVREDYRLLTSGIARNRTLPEREGFVGTPLISNFSELTIVHQFIELEKQEAKQFRLLGDLLEDVPIYTDYLKHQKGVGPAMGGVLVTCLDPYKARHVSAFWKYAGLDVAADGRGRSRREEHMVERDYIDKKGKPQTRMGLTHNPWLKTKMFVLAGSFMRKASPWTESYRGYKHRLETDPAREKISLADWKKKNDAGEPVIHLWPPGRIENAARRYMIKQFLADFWLVWRKMEGLPVTAPYHEAILGHKHRGEAAE